MNEYHLTKDNYLQYAPFDIVAYHELSVAIDRSKQYINLKKAYPAKNYFITIKVPHSLKLSREASGINITHV